MSTDTRKEEYGAGHHTDTDDNEHSGVDLYDNPISPLMPNSPYMRPSAEYSNDKDRSALLVFTSACLTMPS